MKVRNFNMSCTHEGVNIDLNYWEGSNEITASQNFSGKGYTTTRTDRYDLEGNRLSEIEEYKTPFTEQYFAAVDAKIKEFMANVSVME